MVTKQHVLFLGLAGVTVLLWGVVVARHKHNAPGTAQAALRKADPRLSGRIEGQISSLKQETIPRSVEKLSDVNMFAWPGVYPNTVLFHGLPLNANHDQDTIETIMSNRRFRKVLAELGGLDKSKASEIIGRQLSNAVAVYLSLYADEMEVLTERHKISDIDTNHSRGGLSFISGTTNDQVVLLGARLDVLSLAWISGLLELRELKPQVDSVARLALKQRDEMYAANSVDPLAREQMLFEASLYNRQILGCALLGVAEKSSARAAVLAKSKLGVKEEVLATYDAAVTEYDLPVRSGFMKPDRSRGTVTVKYLSPATDSTFNDLSRALMVLP